MKIVVAGGTGFLGIALVNRLVADGHSVIVLTRDPAAATPLFHPDVLLAGWDARSAGGWTSHIDAAGAVVNLSGRSMGGRRWTSREKATILSSRVGSTRAIVEAIARVRKKPPVLVNSSAVGYYGSLEEGEATEESPAGKGFLADVCVEWEESALAARAYGVRVVLPRMAVVLGDNGGALHRMMVPFRFFAGGVIGSGTQWFPWVHRADVLSAIVHAIADRTLSGPANIVSPQAVRMREFCSALGTVMRRPSWTRAPGFLVRIALGEMADMVLTGQRVVPAALQRTGFQFRFPDLLTALADVVK